MALVKLPDGQLVDHNLVESVEQFDGQYGCGVQVNLKGGKQVTIHCDNKEAMKDMLAKVATILDL